MDIDPHTIQQILMKVREQLRCPQCTKKVDVTLDSLKVLGDLSETARTGSPQGNSFAVFQLKCTTCDAYIMLYASIASLPAGMPVPMSHKLKAEKEGSPLRSELALSAAEASSGEQAEGQAGESPHVATTLHLDPKEIQILRKCLKEAKGSFSKLFEDNN